MDGLFWTPRIALWGQPEGQSFTTDKAKYGGLVALKSVYDTGRISPFLEIEAKTGGWAMGNVFLEKNANISFGLSLKL